MLKLRVIVRGVKINARQTREPSLSNLAIMPARKIIEFQKRPGIGSNTSYLAIRWLMGVVVLFVSFTNTCPKKACARLPRSKRNLYLVLD